MSAAKTALCALLLCVASLHAMPRLGCRCIRTRSEPIRLNAVRRFEVIPVSGYCRRTEMRVTLKNNHVVCVNPKKEWVRQMLLEVAQRNQTQLINHQF